MKKLFSIFLLGMFPVFMFGQLYKTKVDEIIELSGIVWNLVGAEEYSGCRIGSYERDIKEYFKDLSNHEAVEYCKKLRQEREIGYDAVYFASLMLYLDNDSILLPEGYTAKSLVDIDPRWTEDGFEHYIVLLNKFYKDSGFMGFFKSHESLYAKIESAFEDRLGNIINEKWFEDMFGIEFPLLTVYISPMITPGNYGADNRIPDSRKGICLGAFGMDSDGNIQIAHYATDIAVHEIMHLFANPLVDRNKDLFKTGDMEALWKCSSESFSQRAVGITSIPYETLTRMFTCMYLADNGEEFYKRRIGNEMAAGFVWMKRCYEFMDKFRNNRKKYKYADGFIPELASYMAELANDIDGLEKEYDNLRPVITSVTPEPGSVIDLSCDNVTYKVTFSEDMLLYRGFDLISEKDLTEVDPIEYGITEINEMGEWIDKRTFVISVPVALYKDLFVEGFELIYVLFINEYGLSLEKKDYKFKYPR